MKEPTRGQERIRTESHLVLMVGEGLKEQLLEHLGEERAKQWEQQVQRP